MVWRIRYLIFPIIIFFYCSASAFLNEILTFRFKMAASTLSVEMLRAVGVSVMQEGNIIDLGIEKLQVVDACNGLRYFMPMILMASSCGIFFQQRLVAKNDPAVPGCASFYFCETEFGFLLRLYLR